MSQNGQLYQSDLVWNQPIQPGQAKLAKAMMDFFPSNVHTALDVGCGDGKITQLLIEQTGRSIVGLDSSFNALSRCNFATIHGDAKTMPFGNKAFDLVMSTDLLEHLPNEIEDNVWQELFRVADKIVMVAVPFREELLDATARCHACDSRFHVNWHQRSYDWPQLISRAPNGWKTTLFVLTGDNWPPYHPIETRFRRHILDEWSGWIYTSCPQCGARGSSPDQVTEMSKYTAASLGEQIYQDLKKRRQLRSHSEILVVYCREGLEAPIEEPRFSVCAEGRDASDASINQNLLDSSLTPYPQSAKVVSGADGNIIVQFPAYESEPSLVVGWSESFSGSVPLSLEDGLGSLFSDDVFSNAGQSTTIHLPRKVITGYYGVIARIPKTKKIKTLQLGSGPKGVVLSLKSGCTVGYHTVAFSDCKAFIQVMNPCWIDELSLANPAIEQESFRWKEIFEKSEESFTAERNALLERAREADRLAVDLQNITAERNALLERAREADRLAVDLQNITTERDLLQSELHAISSRLGVRVSTQLRKKLIAWKSGNRGGNR